ncbi:MAG: glycosyltransferase [Anaerolineae bacterium]
MRILLVQETDWVRRNPVHQHHLMERLVRRGHTVVVVDYDVLWQSRPERSLLVRRQEFPSVSKVFDDAGIRVVRPAILRVPFLCHASWVPTSLWEMYRLMRQYRPDVLVGLTLSNAFLVSLLASRASIPAVLCVLEPYHTMSSLRPLWPVTRLLETLSYRVADRVVVFNERLVAYVHRLGARPERVCRLPTGVDLKRFHPALEGVAVRETYGLTQNDRVLFFMGWLYPFCGLREMALALAQGSQIPSDIKLLVVGDGDIYEDVVQLRKSLGLEDRIILTGKQPYERIPEFVAAADVCLLPSLENDTTREIVPMKVYEYLAAGKPVVATRLPGLVAEFGTNSGVVYADGPVDALQKAAALAARPEEKARLGMASRRYVEEHADWERAAALFEELLLSVQRERGKGYS